jgi:hypothetical protein
MACSAAATKRAGVTRNRQCVTTKTPARREPGLSHLGKQAVQAERAAGVNRRARDEARRIAANVAKLAELLCAEQSANPHVQRQ